MQDRFKFRIWDKDKKKMFDCIQINFTENAYGSNKIKDNECSIHLMYQPHLELMQCTGLKDKNGKLIYEGDILKVENGGYLKKEYLKKVVVWDRKEWQLKQYNNDFKQNCSACKVKTRQRCKYCSQYFSATGHTNFKDFYNGFVIGNIYESPELIGGE